MREVDTVLVATAPDGEFISDSIAAWKWAMPEGTELLVAVPEGVSGGGHGAEVVAVPEDLTAVSALAAVQDSLRRVVADRYILVDHTVLPLRRGFVQWCMKTVSQLSDADPFGLLGVFDRSPCEDVYSRQIHLLEEWGVPHAKWERPPIPLGGGIYVLSAAAAQSLEDRQLLWHAGLRQWSGTFAQYLSWIVQMLGYRQIQCGAMHQQIPPIFAGYAGQLNPAPILLRSEFLLYSPINSVPGYEEGTLRKVYQALRAGSRPTITTLTPIVSPRPQ